MAAAARQGSSMLSCRAATAIVHAMAAATDGSVPMLAACRQQLPPSAACSATARCHLLPAASMQSAPKGTFDASPLALHRYIHSTFKLSPWLGMVRMSLLLSRKAVWISKICNSLTLVGDDADAVEAVALEHAADAVVAEHLERALQRVLTRPQHHQ